jgi:hypothetical protein
LNKIIAAEGDPVEKLRLGLKAYVEFGLKHPNHYYTTFMHDSKKCGEAYQYEGSAGAEAFQILVEGVTGCVQAGRFRETDVLAISQSLWMVIHGITSLLISFGEGFPFVEEERLIDITIETALRGWAG